MRHYARFLRSTAPAALDTQTVNVGGSGTAGNRLRGYTASPVLGSITDGTSDIYGGAAITDLVWDESSPNLRLKITGATNSGWTTMRVGTTDFLRTAASFSSNTWTWANVTTSPFGMTTGVNVTVTFT